MRSCMQASLETMYQLTDKLGEGTFASVYKAKVIYPGEDNVEEVAIKQIKLDPFYQEAAYQEVSRLKKFENDHIVEFKDAIYDQGEKILNLIMQLCEGSLRTELKKAKTYSFFQLSSFLKQMCSAFLELDSKQMMHLDLKPENILIAGPGYYKVCDFGCSQMATNSKFSRMDNQVFGTFNYLAPEMHLSYKGLKKRSSCDVWSLGIILYEMIYGKLPFDLEPSGKISTKQVESYFNRQKLEVIAYPFVEYDLKPITQLIKNFLSPDPQKRMTWQELRKTLILTEKMAVGPEFDKVSDLYERHMGESKIFLHVCVLIDNNVELNPHPFWKENQVVLKEVGNLLVHLSHCYNSQFLRLFSHKMSSKITPQSVDNLLYLAKHIRIEQETRCNNSCIKVKEPRDLPQLQSQIQKQCGKLASLICSYASREGIWQAMEQLQIFCLQIETSLRAKGSLFCEWEGFRQCRDKYM